MKFASEKMKNIVRKNKYRLHIFIPPPYKVCLFVCAVGGGKIKVESPCPYGHPNLVRAINFKLYKLSS